MSDARQTASPVPRNALPRPIRSAAPAPPRDAGVVCERCSAEMFRMHAVWRCPSCGFKTDCCGW